MKFAKKLAVSVAIAGAFIGTAAPASADHTTRNLCAGVVEQDCWFCAYQSTPTGVEPTNCHYGLPGYSWEYCRLWVTAVCVYGDILPN